MDHEDERKEKRSKRKGHRKRKPVRGCRGVRMKSGLTQGFAFSPQSRGGGQCADSMLVLGRQATAGGVRGEHYPLGPLDSRASSTTTRSPADRE